MKLNPRTIAVWVILLALFVGLFAVFSSDKLEVAGRRSLAQVKSDFERSRVKQLEADKAGAMYVVLLTGERFSIDATAAEVFDSLGPLAEGVPYYEAPERKSFSLGGWSQTLLILVVVLAVLVVFLRRMGGQGSILTMRRSPAREVVKVPSVRFSDVGGHDAIRARLEECVTLLKQPAAAEKTGARAPRGVLLEGPPGNGKTLLAKALAAEAGLPFFETSASEFVELFVGVGAARVRDLFERARARQPCVVFIDELDAVGRKRGAASATLTHQEREQALDQLLVALDGFSERGQVLVLAATNRADLLDVALLRPGRFDLVLQVNAPDLAGRAAVLAVHTRGKPLEPGLDLAAVSRASEGFSGAELAQVCNEAALTATRRAMAGGPATLTLADFQAAIGARRSASGADTLDVLLSDASVGLTKPVTPLHVRVDLVSGSTLEGQVVWIDPSVLKLQTSKESVSLQRVSIMAIRAVDATPVPLQALAQAGASSTPDVG